MKKVGLKILNSFGNDSLARVYICEFGAGKLVEFVESRQPPLSWKEKWVLIISTSIGCPIKCIMCDAGGSYKGALSAEQILSQIDFLVSKRYPDFKIPVKKFKVQFARMGEPSLNTALLDVLRELVHRYHAPGLMPCISTVAPRNAADFFEELLKIKDEFYGGGMFQMQFSVHSTDEKVRDQLMPVSKWTLDEISEYGARFYQKGDRKITLNFALGVGISLRPEALAEKFPSDRFLMKFTPVNPTHQALKNRLASYIDSERPDRKYPLIDRLREYGFEVLISIGENEENQIGSNCGQYIMRHYTEKTRLTKSYSYIDP